MSGLSEKRASTSHYACAFTSSSVCKIDQLLGYTIRLVCPDDAFCNGNRWMKGGAQSLFLGTSSLHPRERFGLTLLVGDCQLVPLDFDFARDILAFFRYHHCHLDGSII